MTRIELTRPGPARAADAPLTLDARGRTARAPEDEHIRDLMRAVLFTEPGERVNRPTFGCALSTMVFMPAGDALVAATRALVHGALQQWLAREIVVDSVEVEADETELKVTIVYARRSDGVRRRDVLSHRTAGPR